MNALTLLGGVTGVALLICIIIIGPIFTIWALNLLFGTAIPVTIWTWLSTFWLGGLVSGAAYKASNK